MRRGRRLCRRARPANVVVIVKREALSHGAATAAHCDKICGLWLANPGVSVRTSGCGGKEWHDEAFAGVLSSASGTLGVAFRAFGSRRRKEQTPRGWLPQQRQGYNREGRSGTSRKRSHILAAHRFCLEVARETANRIVASRNTGR